MEIDDLLGRLVRQNVEFVLIGGYASILHGSPMTTQDVDICLHFTRENLGRLVTAIGNLHPNHRQTPNRLALEISDRNWSNFRNLYLETDLGVLDCLGEVLGIGSYAEVQANSEPIQF